MRDLSTPFEPSFHMWFVMLATIYAIIAFVREKQPLEVTSIAVLTGLLLFGQFFPLENADGQNLLGSRLLLSGFANPALIAVLSLLIMGQALIHTDTLRLITSLIKVQKKNAWLSISITILFVAFASAFVNNTPLVVIAIPLLQVMASSAKISDSRVMIPLSYAAILGGMITLIGSSTNLLVSTSMIELGYEGLDFFSFIVPGFIMASVGFVYVLFILPRILSDRSNLTRQLVGNEKEFIAELDISDDSKLIGMECVDGKFLELQDLNVKLIQRGGHLILPPFEGYSIEPDDVLIVAAKRKALANILSRYPGFLLSEEEVQAINKSKIEIEREDTAKTSEPRILAEIMITPASRILDMSLDHVGFHKQYGVIVLGIQRRARVVRRRLGRIRLEPGDVLLVAGRQSMIDSMRGNPDFIVLSGSKKDLPAPSKAPLASIIFLATIGSAALGVMSIPVAAITGAVAMIGTGCLNVRQAVRAMDRKIYLLVGSMLALGTAMQVTGGAEYMAISLMKLPYMDQPLVIGAGLFFLIAITTNILTNNACAILFTPIALTIAQTLQVDGISQSTMNLFFAVTVIFAANCSFATPIGYQTNLLVMGPGHYRFRDFLKGGIPLIFIMWITYILIAKFYFNLA